MENRNHRIVVFTIFFLLMLGIGIFVGTQLEPKQECVYSVNTIGGDVNVYPMNPDTIYKNNATSLTILTQNPRNKEN